MLKYLILLVIMLTGCARLRNGTPGADGTPCTTTRTGRVVYIACPGQDPVAVNDGSDGLQGAPGAAGAAGAPGTIITPIQLCPGVPTYPTSFPEFAMCLGGVLYGVYDQDGDHVFLAELPPGRYRSTSPDACNFTIGSNCEVSH